MAQSFFLNFKQVSTFHRQKTIVLSTKQPQERIEQEEKEYKNISFHYVSLLYMYTVSQKTGTLRFLAELCQNKPIIDIFGRENQEASTY